MTVDELIAHLQRMSAAGAGQCPAMLGHWDSPLRPLDVIEQVFHSDAGDQPVMLFRNRMDGC